MARKRYMVIGLFSFKKVFFEEVIVVYVVSLDKAISISRIID